MLYTPSMMQIAGVPGILKRQWWSKQKLRAWQDDRFRRLVKHAYDHVDFYRSRWSSLGLTPSDIRSVDDLSKLPVITANELKQAPHASLVARGLDLGKCRVVNTSGSTGQPLSVVYHPRDHFVVIKAMSLRHYLAHRVSIRDRLASFSPHPQACGHHAWYERLGIWRRLVLHSVADAQTWMEPLHRFAPHVIAASPMTLLELADAVAQSDCPPLCPQTILSSGARLEPVDRQRIEQTLGGRVHDIYGAYEGGFIAWECPKCPGYHVNSDCVILEVLNEGRPALPGEPGETVITNLYSWAMPFIRYKLGDVVTPIADHAECGRGLPLIGAVWGRNDDRIHLPSGHSVGPYPIYMLVLDNPFVHEWRLLQEETGGCVLQVVAREGLIPPEEKAILERRLTELLRNEVPVRVDAVKRIERDLKTKWKTVLSRVKLDRQP